MSGSTLLPYTDYQALTRDTVTAQSDVDTLSVIAEGIVAEALDRIGISSKERTERLRIFYDPAALGLFGPSGWVYPSATPVTALNPTTAGDLVSDGVTVRNVSPDTDPIGLFGSPVQLDRYCTLTYTGGWTLQTVPFTIKRAIAVVTRSLQRPVTPGDGARLSVRQGDSSETYARAGAATMALDIETWRSIKGWRKRV